MMASVRGIILLIPVITNAQAVLEPPRLDSLIRSGIHAVMTDRFELADSLFSIASTEFPKHPVGPVMRAAVVHIAAEDDLSDVNTDRIDSLQVIAELRSEGYSLGDQQGRLALAFLSSARGVVSMEAARLGVWIKAIRLAVQATSLGEDILERDSSIADAGLAVGSYYYWKSRTIGFMTWLPFVADSRQEGIDLLRKCAVSGVYQRYAAMNGLAWILHDAGAYQDGLRWNSEALREYPTCRALLRTQARLLLDVKDSSGSASQWGAVLASATASGSAGLWPAFEAMVRMTELRIRSGETGEMVGDRERIAEMERTLASSADSRRKAMLIERSRALLHRMSSGIAGARTTD